MIDALLIVTLTAAFLAWFFDPFYISGELIRFRISWGWKPWLAVGALMVLRVRFGSNDKAKAGLAYVLPRIALAIGITLLTLLLIEGALSIAGVPRGEAVFVVHGERGEALRADGSMVKDATLLWRFQPGATFNGRTVNALGFLDREVTPAKPPDTMRVICLGDSCSAQGTPPYSGHVHQRLQEQAPNAQPWEAFNMAVHGYTILQGAALFATQVTNLEPDVVTLFFGWNDHWLAEQPDSLRLSRAGSPAMTALRNSIARKRIATALTPSRKSTNNEWQVRVPPEVYESTLRNLIADIRAIDARPLLLTAPRAETLHRQIVHGGHARSVDEAIALHDTYIEITRRVAQETNADLLDLAAIFNEPTHFSNDGIHYTNEGIQHIGILIHGKLLSMFHNK